MKKQWIMALALLLCLCVLTACQTSEPERFTVKTADTSGSQAQQTQSSGAYVEDGVTYDPLAEEDDYTADLDYLEGEIATAVPVVTTPAPTVRGEFAGATPVPLNPIDLPTPTTAPTLPAFSYRTYDATKLGLSFEGPVGWTVDDSSSTQFTITNPTVARGLYQAQLTITAEKVNSQYTTTQLEEVVKNMLNALEGSDQLKSFSPSKLADRSLLGAKGRYANYTGVLTDGTEIAGRVHVTCVEKVLYTVHITYPKVYTESYKEQVYNKLRDTIQITK